MMKRKTTKTPSKERSPSVFIKQNIGRKKSHRIRRKHKGISALNCKNKYTLLQKDVFELFVESGEIVEVRIPKVWGESPVWNGFAKGAVSGYFDNFKAFKKAVSIAIKNQQSDIYFTLQVIDPRLIGRSNNVLKAASITTSDNNVLYYRWIPIDIDPVRPAGISSSSSEFKKAIELRDTISEWILDTTEYSDLITAISGNGAHILIKLPEDLKVNDESKELIKSFLENVDRNFSTDDVKIDTTVNNPARIWKLYGTKAMKGDVVPKKGNREALIHRKSYIDNIGELI